MKLEIRQPSNREDIVDYAFDDDFETINDVRLLESHIVYFSAGESKIKEILVKRDPSFSV